MHISNAKYTLTWEKIPQRQKHFSSKWISMETSLPEQHKDGQNDARRGNVVQYRVHVGRKLRFHRSGQHVINLGQSAAYTTWEITFENFVCLCIVINIDYNFTYSDQFWLRLHILRYIYIDYNFTYCDQCRLQLHILWSIVMTIKTIAINFLCDFPSFLATVPAATHSTCMYKNPELAYNVGACLGHTRVAVFLKRNLIITKFPLCTENSPIFDFWYVSK